MKKTIKIFAVVAATALIGIILVVANGFVGNPVSKMLAKSTASKHLSQHYANTDYYIEEVSYSFKTGDYYARIASASSADTYFSLSITSIGRLDWDSYSDMVPNGRNTLDRINKQYRNLVEGVFDADDFPYVSYISFGDIKEKRDLDVDSPEKDFGIDATTLVLDKDYDIADLGRQYGSITFYAQDEAVTTQRASEILLDITRILEANNVPFYAIDFVLQKPRNEDDTPNADYTQISLIDFLYSDIYPEGLTERVNQNHEQTTAYHAAMDAQKQ